MNENFYHARSLFISLALVLIGFGVLMVHSASITSWPTEFEKVYLSRHVVFLCVALLLGGIASLIPAKIWWKAAPWIFAITLVLLCLILLPSVGYKVNGARRWLRFAGLSLQPAELAKIAVPLLLVRLLIQNRKSLSHWYRGTLPIIWPLLIVAPLVAWQPDLGTALFLLGGGAIALFLGGWPIRNFVIAGSVIVPVMGFLIAMRPYQLNRITGYLATWIDLNQAPYQLKQSLLTLGSGGLSGVGIGKGSQKLSFLPEANTDFVFAVVGEELGLPGTLGIIAIWVSLLLIGYRILRPLDKSGFPFLIGMVLLSQLVIQAAINVAVVTAMVPPKGIPHPLLSYGGSNLVVTLVSFGIILAMSRDVEPESNANLDPALKSTQVMPIPDSKFFK